MLPPALQAVIWSGIAHVPLLARRRGARGLALNMARRQLAMRKALELPNLILAHSTIVPHMLAQAGLSARVVQLSNGLDLEWAANFPGKSGSPLIRFGYIGQVTKIKGVHLLIQAFQQLAMPERARLDIWGDLQREPIYGQEIQDLVAHHPAIALHGPFTRLQLAKVLAEIDVLVVPSLWYENAPLVIAEAFATQTPVIATNLGGMAEAVSHEGNGLLFARGDVVDLRNQLQRMLEEPGLLAQLRSGIGAVKAIDQEISQLEAIYSALIADPQKIITTLTGAGQP